MPKLCNHKGCKYNQFGGGYCRNHQWLRTDKKQKPTPKRTPIRKRSIKQTKLLGERKVLQKQDWEFYLEIWEERDHVCENCGCSLGNEPLTIYFDHLLEKSKHPDLRHEKENIMLLCWEDHTNKTNGFPADKVKQNIIKICDKFGKNNPFL